MTLEIWILTFTNMLTLRQRIFTIIGVVAGIIVAGILLYLFAFKADSQPRAFVKSLFHPTPTEEKVVSPTEGESTAVVSSPPVFVKYSPEVYAKQVARMFVERFGSYSNQNNNQHLVDILPLVTAKMEKWVKTQAITAGGEYQGVTTRVIASRVDAISADQATVIVDVQQEKDGKEGTKVEQRSGRVELIRVEEEWKVDGLYWNK